MTRFIKTSRLSKVLDITLLHTDCSIVQTSARFKSRVTNFFSVMRSSEILNTS